MSVSRFARQKSELEEFIITKDKQKSSFGAVPTTVSQRISAARERMNQIRKFCKENYTQQHDVPQKPSNYKDLDFIRSTMNRSLIKVPVKDISDKLEKALMSNSRFSKSPSKRDGSKMKST